MRLPPWKYGPECLFTPGSQTSIFFPVTGPMPTANAGKAASSFKMWNSTGDVTIEVAVRYSDDGVTWGAPTNVVSGATLTADGAAYNLMAVLPGTVKRSMQWGIHIKNTALSATELCWAWLNLETQNG